MSDSLTETIKGKLDIVSFLRDYLPLHPAGKNFKALCPFHREKTPSFMVSPERQSWHCFGCSLGGDAFTFLMHFENIDFGEALKILAEKTGVELRRLNPSEYKFTGLLYDINNSAKEFFQRQLGQAEAAKKYLAERGLKKETIDEFELGWAPNSSEELNLYLLSSGFSPDDVLRSGLAFKNERNLQFDIFRGRVMFPIHNHFGKVAGFTGRILPQFDGGQMGKYVNSPETPIFSKSKILYGLWKSKNLIREAGSAFLVEGQMDFLLSYQAGVRNVAASSGTALTKDHLRVLRRLTDQLVLSFDNDEAGWEAGERAIDLAEASDFSVKVATLKNYKDPGEAAEKNPEYLKKTIENAKPAPEFYFEKYLERKSLEPSSREYINNLRIILGKIKIMASPVLQNFWLKKLSEKTNIDEKALNAEMEKIETAGSSITEGVREEARRSLSRWEFLSESILKVAYAGGSLDVLIDDTQYLSPPYDEIYVILRKGGKSSADSRLDALLNFIFLSPAEVEYSEIEELKSQLQREYIKERRRQLSDLIKAAEIKGDEETLNSILREFNKLPVL